MKNILFTVELSFESDITEDSDIKEIAENIARAIVLETNGRGIAPQDGDTYLEVVRVTPQFNPEIKIIQHVIN